MHVTIELDYHYPENEDKQKRVRLSDSKYIPSFSSIF